MVRLFRDLGLLPLLVCLPLAVALLVACSGDSPGGEKAATASADSQVPGVKPEVAVPEGEAPPDELVVEELIAGEGAEVAPGDTVQIHWVGRAWSSGVEFDSSWDRGPPLTVEVGGGGVIAGLDGGLRGLRVGGRYRLVIPPELAYGSRGTRGAIGPGETLVMVVDVLEIVPTQDAG